MSHDFYSAVKLRRTVYTLGKNSPISDARIEEVLKDALSHAPSAFNSQSGRIVLLLGKNHDELWEATKAALKPLVPVSAFPQTEAKIDGFKAAYGTVLFFEDSSVISGFQEKFAAFKDNFPVWSDNGTGILQYIVWTSLAVEGLGASLQHYHPLINDWVAKKTGVPPTWKLTAQMPFGLPTAAAGPKEVSPLDGRFKVLS